jgi:hypothetical protein
MTQFSHGVLPTPQGLGSMPDNVVYLDSLRQGRSVPVSPYTPQRHPEEKIRQAADAHMIDKIREWVECAEAVTADEPLRPADRVKVMRVLAILHPEPRQ